MWVHVCQSERFRFKIKNLSIDRITNERLAGPNNFFMWSPYEYELCQLYCHIGLVVVLLVYSLFWY